MYIAICKGLSVNEDYNYLWAVRSFDVEVFEYSVAAKIFDDLKCLQKILSSECGVSFY